MEAIRSGDSGAFVWPKNDDIIDCQPEKIIQAIPDPIPVSNRHIGWSKELIDQIEAKFFSE